MLFDRPGVAGAVLQSPPLSYIRKGKYNPAPPPAAPPASRSGDPPQTLQRAELESSGQRLNS